MVSLQKKEKVSQLIEKLQSNPNFVLINFGNTPHTSLEELRSSLRKSTSAQSPFEVIKNSLFKVVASRIDKPELARDEVLAGPTALLTLPTEWVEALQAFYGFAKRDTSISFKIGVIDGTVYQQSDLVRLAMLPTRTELIAKILGSFKSPQSRTVFAMKYNATKLVHVLNAKAKAS